SETTHLPEKGQKGAPQQCGRRRFLAGWTHPLLEQRRDGGNLSLQRGVTREDCRGVPQHGSRRSLIRRQLRRGRESKPRRQISLLRGRDEFSGSCDRRRTAAGGQFGAGGTVSVCAGGC